MLELVSIFEIINELSNRSLSDTPGNSLMRLGSDTQSPIRQFLRNFLMGNLFELHLENLGTHTLELALPGCPPLGNSTGIF